MTTKSLAKYEAMPIQSMAELAQAGKLIAQSGMFGINNDAAGFVVVATCHQQGITLLDYARTYHTVENKPSMKADAMAAEFRKRGGKYKIVNRDAVEARALFSFEGQDQEFSYTMERAVEAGINKSKNGIKHNWKSFPENMLWARMMSNAVRVLCPEIVAGLYTPEEAEDFTPDTMPTPTSEPTPIDVEFAEARLQSVTEPPNFEQALPADYSTCPIGGEDWLGKAWLDMKLETLQNALQFDDPALTDYHKTAIKYAISEKEKVTA